MGKQHRNRDRNSTGPTVADPPAPDTPETPEVPETPPAGEVPANPPPETPPAAKPPEYPAGVLKLAAAAGIAVGSPLFLSLLGNLEAVHAAAEGAWADVEPSIRKGVLDGIADFRGFTRLDVAVTLDAAGAPDVKITRRTTGTGASTGGTAKRAPNTGGTTPFQSIAADTRKSDCWAADTEACTCDDDGGALATQYGLPRPDYPSAKSMAEAIADAKRTTRPAPREVAAFIAKHAPSMAAHLGFVNGARVWPTARRGKNPHAKD